MSVTEIDDAAVVVSRHQDMIAADVGAEAVILNVRSGVFFQLNQTASLIWTALESPISVGALCTKIADSFSVDPAVCRRDVIEFLVEMRDRDLITIG